MKTHQGVNGRALCQQRFPKPELVTHGANCCACANAAKVELRATDWYKTRRPEVVLSRANALDIWHRVKNGELQ